MHFADASPPFDPAWRLIERMIAIEARLRKIETSVEKHWLDLRTSRAFYLQRRPRRAYMRGHPHRTIAQLWPALVLIGAESLLLAS